MFFNFLTVHVCSVIESALRLSKPGTCVLEDMRTDILHDQKEGFEPL